MVPMHTADRQTEVEEVEQVVAAASGAAGPWAGLDRSARSQALRAVADQLDAAADELVPIGVRETHLGEQRLRSELRRTTFQLRIFADVVDDGGYLDVRIDHADPDWPMGAPRPDLRRILHPLGPVLVFAASNFPFAFSVAGGDTASALAAGCPVVVKAHPGHPELSAATAAQVQQALAAAGAPAGVLGLIFGPTPEWRRCGRRRSRRRRSPAPSPVAGRCSTSQAPGRNRSPFTVSWAV